MTQNLPQSVAQSDRQSDAPSARSQTGSQSRSKAVAGSREGTRAPAVPSRPANFADDPADCWQCRAARALGRARCHFHRAKTDEAAAELIARADKAIRLADRRLAREHPNAPLMPHERPSA